MPEIQVLATKGLLVSNYALLLTITRQIVAQLLVENKNIDSVRSHTGEGILGRDLSEAES